MSPRMQSGLQAVDERTFGRGGHLGDADPPAAWSLAWKTRRRTAPLPVHFAETILPLPADLVQKGVGRSGRGSLLSWLRN